MSKKYIKPQIVAEKLALYDCITTSGENLDQVAAGNENEDAINFEEIFG